MTLASELSEMGVEQVLDIWIVKTIGFDEHFVISTGVIGSLEDALLPGRCR
jgi:hypothetical protein